MDAPAAFFSTQSLADRQLIPRLGRYLAGGRRALVTSRAAARLGALRRRYADRIFVLDTSGGSGRLHRLPQTTIERARNFVLYPLGLRIQAPPRVALALYGREAMLVRNHNDFAAGVKLTFHRPLWPPLRELQTADGAAAVRVDYNLAQMQVAPKTTRLLRLIPRGRG
jgi:hypothetical protein